MVDTLIELIKRWLYVRLVGTVRSLTGVRVHYRAEYQDYLQSPRWYILRTLRLAIDGHRCTHRVNLRRCDKRTTLQIHHTSYLHKGAPGVSGMLAELSDLRTLCDYHHTKES